jgi:hypothetical protein
MPKLFSKIKANWDQCNGLGDIFCQKMEEVLTQFLLKLQPLKQKKLCHLFSRK